jgi:hypothetical protein
MLDTLAVERLIQQQIAEQVSQQINKIVGSQEWMEAFEQRILEYVQSRVIAKFSNAEALPEIVETVKKSVAELLSHGQIPGIDQYVDSSVVRKTIDIAVEQWVDNSIDTLGTDAVWLEKIERQITQHATDNVIRQLGQVDVNSIIKQRIDENMIQWRQDLLTQFASTGIDDQATACQLTVMDESIIVENQLMAKDLNIVNVATINDLVVKGSVNIDNRSWDLLSDGISQKTLAKLNQEWQDTLTAQVVNKINDQGIKFESVKIGDDYLVDGTKLSFRITETNIQELGVLRKLETRGDSHLNNRTLSVLNKRIGINTETPEKALSVWDEEVSIVIGKHKLNMAYLGTNRDQGVSIGVNREPQIEIGVDGLTTVKRLQVGLHKIGHDTQVPGWSGVRGDLVFNTNPGPNRVFAWVCLGAHKWQALKSAE